MVGETEMTIPFYDEHGKDFFERTVDVDISHLYEMFLKYVPDGGHILDAGCGSGRDTKYFLEKGYQVTAFDGSATLAKMASELTGLDVRQMLFEEMAYEAEFDAVWANATLLHVPFDELPGIFEKFIAALKAGGIWFATFKKGEGEILNHDGRLFVFFGEKSLKAFIERFEALEVLELTTTEDSRDDHRGEYWLNLITRKR